MYMPKVEELDDKSVLKHIKSVIKEYAKKYEIDAIIIVEVGCTEEMIDDEPCEINHCEECDIPFVYRVLAKVDSKDEHKKISSFYKEILEDQFFVQNNIPIVLQYTKPPQGMYV